MQSALKTKIKNLKKDANHLKIAQFSKRQRINIEKRERKTKNEKKSNNNNKYFFNFYFCLQKSLYFVKNVFGKTQFTLLHFYYSFFTRQVIRNTVIKHQLPYRYTLVFQTRYFDPKYLARYFNVDFDSNGVLFLFLCFTQVPSILEKNRNTFLRKVFSSPHSSDWITYCRIVFQTMYISKICTQP